MNTPREVRANVCPCSSRGFVRNGIHRFSISRFPQITEETCDVNGVEGEASPPRERAAD